MPHNPDTSDDVAPPGACNASLQRDLPQRRSIRLPGYDYSQAGWYFVTIMAADGKRVFGRITSDADILYTAIGETVCQSWLELTAAYPRVHVDTWVVMPNHFHAIVGLLPASGQPSAKPLGQLIAAFKATATRRARPLRASTESLWQRSFYEHIIRNASELEVYREYIRNNPRRWLEKKFGLYDASSSANQNHTA